MSKSLNIIKPIPDGFQLHGVVENGKLLTHFGNSDKGYTSDIKSRLYKHKNNKGAKPTKGHKWQLILLSRGELRLLLYDFD